MTPEDKISLYNRRIHLAIKIWVACLAVVVMTIGVLWKSYQITFGSHKQQQENIQLLEERIRLQQIKINYLQQELDSRQMDKEAEGLKERWLQQGKKEEKISLINKTKI